MIGKRPDPEPKNYSSWPDSQSSPQRWKQAKRQRDDCLSGGTPSGVNCHEFGVLSCNEGRMLCDALQESLHHLMESMIVCIDWLLLAVELLANQVKSFTPFARVPALRDKDSALVSSYLTNLRHTPLTLPASWLILEGGATLWEKVSKRRTLPSTPNK